MSRRLSGNASSGPDAVGGWLLAAAIIFAAANMRPGVASVAPVLEDLRADLGMSGAAASILTSLPVICFALGGFLAPWLARRFGPLLTFMVVLACITLGQVMRLGPNVGTLFTGTLLTGLAIAIANVLMPAIVKRDFPHRLGMMMGAYISLVVGGAAVTAALTIPVFEAFGQRWRAGMGIWTVPAALAVVLWLVATRSRWRLPASTERASDAPVSLLRDPMAWHVTMFFALQGLVFHALMAWMPSMYRSLGMDPEAAGRLLSLMIILGVPTALVLPSLLTRSNRQGFWVLVTTAFQFVGLSAMLIAPLAHPYLWTILTGVGTGMSFPLALTLVVLRSRNSSDAEQLSAMSQRIGYAVAATGPFVFGLLHDLTVAWTMPLLFVTLTVILQALTGLAASRPRCVGRTRPS